MPDCDDTFYDVTVLLPVTLRFWASNEDEAMAQYKDIEMQILGSMQSFSVGFPETFSVEEVVDIEP